MRLDDPRLLRAAMEALRTERDYLANYTCVSEGSCRRWVQQRSRLGLTWCAAEGHVRNPTTKIFASRRPDSQIAALSLRDHAKLDLDINASSEPSASMQAMAESELRRLTGVDPDAVTSSSEQENTFGDRSLVQGAQENTRKEVHERNVRMKSGDMNVSARSGTVAAVSSGSESDVVLRGTLIVPQCPKSMGNPSHLGALDQSRRLDPNTLRCAGAVAGADEVASAADSLSDGSAEGDVPRTHFSSGATGSKQLVAPLQTAVESPRAPSRQRNSDSVLPSLNTDLVPAKSESQLFALLADTSSEVDSRRRGQAIAQALLAASRPSVLAVAEDGSSQVQTC